MPEQFLDKQGKPLSGGTLTVFVTNTAHKAKIYSDVNGTEIDNPIVITDAGTLDLWLDDTGYYDFLLLDKDGNEIWFIRGRSVNGNASQSPPAGYSDSLFDQNTILSDLPTRPAYVNPSLVNTIGEDHTRIGELETNKQDKLTDAQQAAVDSGITADKLAGDIQLDSSIDIEPAVIKLIKVIGHLGDTTGTTIEYVFPTASVTQNGFISKDDLAQVYQNQLDIESLKGKGLAVGDLGPNPVAGDTITNYYTEKTGNQPVDGSTVVNTNNGQNITYIYNNGGWDDIGGYTGSVPIASNTNLGIVKGNTESGYIYVNADGSMQVNGWDTINATVNNKQDALTPGQLDAVNSGITADKVTQFEGKQDALTESQLEAVNSGITSDKVAKIDDIDNKQDKLTEAQQAAVDSGITAELVSQIGTGGDVEDVKVNGVSVVTDKIANIPLYEDGKAGVVNDVTIQNIINQVVAEVPVTDVLNSSGESLLDGTVAKLKPFKHGNIQFTTDNLQAGTKIILPVNIPDINGLINPAFNLYFYSNESVYPVAVSFYNSYGGIANWFNFDLCVFYSKDTGLKTSDWYLEIYNKKGKYLYYKYLGDKGELYIAKDTQGTIDETVNGIGNIESGSTLSEEIWNKINSNNIFKEGFTEGTLTQEIYEELKNSGDAPVQDVQDGNGNSLVTNKIAIVNLSGKQDTLSQDQLNAVNSGITSDKVNATVQLDTTLTIEAAVVKLTKKLGKLGEVGTTTDYVLPTATIEQNGLISKDDLATIYQNQQDIESLQGKGLAVGDVGTNPVSDANLTNFYKTTTTKDPVDGSTVINTNGGSSISYVYATSTWHMTGSSSVATATNTTLGVVKGSVSTEGYIYVNSDGSMQLNGYDAIYTAIGQKQDALTQAQLNAVNSGITSDVITTINNNISNKIDKTYPAANASDFQSSTAKDGVWTINSSGSNVTINGTTYSLANGVAISRKIGSSKFTYVIASSGVFYNPGSNTWSIVSNGSGGTGNITIAADSVKTLIDNIAHTDSADNILLLVKRWIKNEADKLNPLLVSGIKNGTYLPSVDVTNPGGTKTQTWSFEEVQVEN
jgi:hypothetical protein